MSQLNGSANAIEMRLAELKKMQPSQMLSSQDVDLAKHDVLHESDWYEEVDRVIRDPNTVKGGDFILDEPVVGNALWGSGADMLWSKDEILVIVGTDGSGKSTIAQQLVLARLGLIETVLGFDVVPDLGRVLYLAADRPRQIARSLRRMIDDSSRDYLNKRLVVHVGLPTGQLGDEPEWLVMLAKKHGATTIVVDSLKDFVSELSKEEAALRAMKAIKLALLQGTQIIILHHDRKSGQAGRPSIELSDVFGSRWITAGAGSVLGLFPLSGDIVRLNHLKSPVEPVGPLEIRHDHATGVSVSLERLSAETNLRRLGGVGSAREIAEIKWSTKKPDKRLVDRTVRELEAALVAANPKIGRHKGNRGGVGGSKASQYFLIDQL